MRNLMLCLTIAVALTPSALFAQDAPATTRDPLTGMTMGGERVVILVDTSASMLDDTLVDVLRRRNMVPEERRAAPKWQQVVSTVERLAAQLEPGTRVQIIGFAEQAASLIDGSNGRWVTVSDDGRELASAVAALRDVAPSGPTNLLAAITALRSLQPAPDNVYLLVDGLPTRDDAEPARAGVTSNERTELFNAAVRDLPPGVPINVVLFPMEGDPWATPLYWELALRTGGGLLAAPASTGARAPTPFDLPDDEHVIFIVDTSGSMQSYAWNSLREQIRATLDAYPALKGVQIMNDEGRYLFQSYRGRWLPDTPATRESIMQGLTNWDDYSDSSPREGILAAIDAFSDPSKSIALYVYSDDFSRGSIPDTVREVGARNRADDQGTRHVRINAVAFPVFWQVYAQLHSAASYAVLMREIALENGGRFVALPAPSATAGPQAAR